METTRRGFFGFVASLLAGVPVLKQWVAPSPQTLTIKPDDVVTIWDGNNYHVWVEMRGPVAMGDPVAFNADGYAVRAGDQWLEWGTATAVDGRNVLVRRL